MDVNRVAGAKERERERAGRRRQVTRAIKRGLCVKRIME